MKYLMGLGHGSRGAPPSWIQLSSVIVNVLQGLDYTVMIADPLTGDVIHTVGSMFMDDPDLYCWDNSLKTGKRNCSRRSRRKQMCGELS